MKVRYWLLAAVLALAVLVPKLMDWALINRAGLVTTRAMYRETDWSAAEQSWFQAMAASSVAAQARDRLCRTYQAWFAVEPSAAAGVTAQLVYRANPASNQSDTLAYCGDRFRAQGQLAVASMFYQAAFANSTFSSAAVENATRFNASLLADKGAGNLVRNGDFANGLTHWQTAGQPGPQAMAGAVRLGCDGCQVEQEIPVLGASAYYLLKCLECLSVQKTPTEGTSLYRFTVQLRSEPAAGALKVEFQSTEGNKWSLNRNYRLGRDWETISEWILYPGYGSPELRLALVQTDGQAVWIRNVRVERADALDNRLINASFDYVQPGSANDEFPAWRGLFFRGQPHAQGWYKSVVGNGSAGALELGLTDAADRTYAVGVQQPCGEWIAGTQLEMQSDVSIPQDLRGVYAWVGAVIYDSKSTIYIGSPLKSATDGWVQQKIVSKIPPDAGPFDCMFIAQLVAERPLSGVREVARFDNILLRQVDALESR